MHSLVFAGVDVYDGIAREVSGEGQAVAMRKRAEAGVAETMKQDGATIAAL